MHLNCKWNSHTRTDAYEISRAIDAKLNIKSPHPLIRADKESAIRLDIPLWITYSFLGDGERRVSRGFFSATIECLETFTSSERVFPCARGCENEREEEELTSSSAEKRNFASAEIVGVRSRLYRGFARGVVSRAERVRSAVARHSINQSCCCCCCCCIARQ